jgi:hypothetical protein
VAARHRKGENAFFGGTNPAIRTLRVEDSCKSIADDILWVYSVGEEAFWPFIRCNFDDKLFA